MLRRRSAAFFTGLILQVDASETYLCRPVSVK
jgi:hypothetical protein